MEINKELLEAREESLERARAVLKTQFIGIDTIIDKFINSVKIWYILPEIQSRPLIINLWGITGVGKTDLVRKFVKAIEFTDKFTEIQMDSQSGSATIEDYLETSFDSNDTQGILLLDEIQRFRTIRRDGSDNNSSKFQDLWMLLSDGTFQSNAKLKQELIKMILEEDYWDERDEPDDDDDEPDKIPLDELVKTESDIPKKVKKQKYQTSYWEAKNIKKLLNLSESMYDIMKWSKIKKMDLIKSSLSNSDTYEGKKYTKLLIIISGNLDEAFGMANMVNDADRDADVYHEYSKSIDIITIKGALRNRFKPEQIARLGNVHLIYPIPNRSAYESIIKQKVEQIINKIREENGIEIKVDDTILKVIYDNGVFPTQGVRPVLSTVSSIIENSLPTFLYEYLKAELTQTINLTYKDGFIISKIGEKLIKLEIPTVLDDIKKSQTMDNKALVSVHEAGHAILYAKLFKTVPTQIVASTADEETGGFIGTHSTIGSRGQILNNIIVTFGGRVAEELIFGVDSISSGAATDMEHATEMASSYVRRLAMDDDLGVVFSEYKQDGLYKSNINETNIKIESLLKTHMDLAREMITNHLEFLLEVSEDLMEKSSLTQEEFKTIAEKYLDEEITIVNAGDTLDINYEEKLNDKLRLVSQIKQKRKPYGR
jgi:hypothetical protein